MTRTRRHLMRGAVWAAALLAGCTLARSQGVGLLPVNAAPADYVVAPLTANCLQNYRLFLPPPPNVKPPGGWPVLIHLDLGGFTTSKDFSSLPAEHALAKVLAQGVAVITARATTSAATLDCDGTPEAVAGRGMFHPPGAVAPDLGFAPYDSALYAMPEKDAAMIVQHVRFNAGRAGHLLGSLDRHRVAVEGFSAGAIALSWAALGPDRRGLSPFAGLGGQYDMPTRADVALLGGGAVWWPIYDPALKPGITHFGWLGHSELPAPTIGDALPSDLVGASALHYDDVMLNPSLRLRLQYVEPSHCEDYVGTAESDAGNVRDCGFPLCFEGGGLEGMPPPEFGLHPAWSGYSWKERHGGTTQLVISSETAAGQAGGVPYTFVALAALEDDAAAWLRAQLEAPLDPWITITEARPHNDPDAAPVPVAVAGTKGLPVLKGTGSLQPGSTATIALTHARPHSPVTVVIGVNPLAPPAFGHANLPWHGGLMVPTPTLVIDGLKTGHYGDLTLAAPWPANVPPFTQLYVQAWIQDFNTPDGFAATPALQLTSP